MVNFSLGLCDKSEHHLREYDIISSPKAAHSSQFEIHLQGLGDGCHPVLLCLTKVQKKGADLDLDWRRTRDEV